MKPKFRKRARRERNLGGLSDILLFRKVKKGLKPVMEALELRNRIKRRFFES